MGDQSRVSGPKQGEEGIPIRRHQWQPGTIAGIWEGGKVSTQEDWPAGVSEPNQDERETSQEDQPVWSIQVG